jgi:3-dehydrosphinganine reductase
MKPIHQYQGKTVFVAGGSSGLGKAIAEQLAAQGAHVTIFARRQKQLDEARSSLMQKRSSTDQDIQAVSLDLANPSEVETVFGSQPRTPDILYLVAGGTPNECGFFTDIDAQSLESCMNLNYYTAAYPAQTLLKMWVEDDKRVQSARTSSPTRLRQIVFINSAAALLPLPGYAAYSPTKAAVRSLADTLRMEALRLSNPASTYTIHCAFPSNFISPAFLQEQTRKPELTKQLEGTAAPISELEKKLPTSDKMARTIMAGVEKGEFAICDDSLESGLLWANMVGTSPKRGLGIWDTILAIVVGLFVWPVIRRQFDNQCRKGRKKTD